MKPKKYESYECEARKLELKSQEHEIRFKSIIKIQNDEHKYVLTGTIFKKRVQRVYSNHTEQNRFRADIQLGVS